ncbi:MAG: hypothetical protein NTW09_03675 [Candidatus Omnitrophica bacterium]|nr:hypothetical protein [Candidatus Omnitrophota bacterium]
MRAKGHLPLILLLIAVTFFAYRGTLNNSFVYDDYALVVENGAIKNLDLRRIVSYFTDRNTTAPSDSFSKNMWRPLVTTSFAVDYKLWGLNPLPYHAETVLWHIINVILVYIMTMLILDGRLASFCGALIFALHPAQTENVAWVAGRTNLMFFAFFIASLIFYIRSRKIKGVPLSYGLSLAFFVLSLLSKEMAVTLPFIIILYDRCFGARRAGIKYYVPFFLVAGFYLFTRFSVLGSITQGSWWGGTVYNNIIIAVKAVAEYVRLLLLPVNLKIAYFINTAFSLREIAYIVLAALAVVLSALVLGRVSNKRTIIFYLSWFFITLVPVCNIVPFWSVMSERFLYLPSVGFASLCGILFAALIGAPARRRSLRIASAAVFTAVMIFYCVSTITRSADWRNEIALFSKDVMRSRQNPMAHYNMGLVYAKTASRLSKFEGLSRDYYNKAEEEFKETIRLETGSYLAYVRLADIYNETGRYGLAIQNFKKAKALRDGSGIYGLLDSQARYNDLIQVCRKRLSVLPDDVNTYVYLGKAYYMKNEYQKAKRAWLKAAGLSGSNPDFVKVINSL